MLRKVIILFLIMVFHSLVFAQEVYLKFEEANKHYRDGNHLQALLLYHDIENNGFFAYELYYNLANTYMKLDSVAAAILYYEKAKKMAPQDEDVKYNLKLANLKITDKIEPLPELFYNEWSENIAKLFSSDKWAYLTLLFLWLTIIMTAIYVLSVKRSIKRLCLSIITMFTLAVVISAIYAGKQYDFENTEKEAIVFSSIVYIKNSPDKSGTNLFILHEGIKVEVLDKVGEWKKIRIADGNLGWLHQSAIKTI